MVMSDPFQFAGDFTETTFGTTSLGAILLGLFLITARQRL
jgi:hypothetical protein